MKLSSTSLLRWESLLLLITLFAACSSEDDHDINSPCSDPSEHIYQEVDGIITVEMENTTIGEGWGLKTESPDFTGKGYLQWEGETAYNNPGNGLLTYRIQVNTPGTYRFLWRGRINEGNSGSDANDAWLRMADATDFFGYKAKNGSYVYPKDSGKTPNPNGSGKEGWFKIYLNKLNEWAWISNTSDNDAHAVFATFEKAGIYTVEISGRSKGFAIDRFSLFHENVNEADATDAILNPSITCQ
ncbi:hypothetical protein [Persicobacter sp. CCB-QB2]|uniref:hypothetical protein n=1 Tax=Persicobacter sp. CCB-QB2 TaxID=1561025 RepID=UPI0006A9A6B1|nr:hypothetical protein [Persicobacter sp. CCB-QB2]